MVALNFSPQFADAVAAGTKTQTIRQTARAKAGQALQLYTGQRTKACRKLADAVCIDCTYVGMTERGVTLGDVSRFPSDRDDFARVDGFDNYADMWRWFSSRYETEKLLNRTRKRWLPLEDYAAKRLDLDTAAKELGRSKVAVRARLRRLRFQPQCKAKDDAPLPASALETE